MSNPEQTVPLDLMIRRLEEANARAYELGEHPDERVSESQQDAARHSSDQQKSSVIRSSRGWLVLSLVGSLLAACLSVVAFVWQPSYLNAAKLIVARSEPPRTAPEVIAPTAVSPELVQRLQTMAHDLANVAQGIEQLKSGQEQMVRDNAAVGVQLKATLSQVARDNAVVAGQLKASQEQMTRYSAAVVEQLKASQEQMVRRTATRARPKPIPTPPQDGDAVVLGR